MKKTVLLTLFVVATLAASAQEKNTSQSYIEKFKDNAIAIMHQSGIPASIILGIAMHESGCGNSTIATKLNNQFGMKGSGTNVYYKGKKKVTTPYKQYESVLDSFDDFARVISEKKKFAGLTEQLQFADYTAWVKGIEKRGYASSKTWGKQVMALISKYNLDAFDSKPDSTKFDIAPKNDQQ